MQSGMLGVEGADLYYEVRGAGPALLLIAGAGGDAGFFTGIAEELSDAFTVITYDRRANSRSTGRAEAPMLLSDQADDAKALIDGLAAGRALVFGSSGGAIVTLDLCARHPGSVIAGVAHEPPVFRLLPPHVEGADFYARMAAMYREVGTEVMGMRFAGAMGGQGAFDWPEDLLQRFMGNVAYLFTQEWAEWEKFVPDFEALAAAGAPVLLAGAAANRGRFNSLPAMEIASRLGTAWLEFPGIHLEFLVRPQGFAAGLRALYTQLFTSREGIPAIWRQPAQA